MARQATDGPVQGAQDSAGIHKPFLHAQTGERDGWARSSDD